VPGDLIMLFANLTWTLVYVAAAQAPSGRGPSRRCCWCRSRSHQRHRAVRGLETAISPARIAWSANVVAAMVYMAVFPSLAGVLVLGHRHPAGRRVIPVYFAT